MSVIGYPVPQISTLLGIPYATLDSWVRNGFFVPSLAQASGRGSRRMYSFFDVLMLKVTQLLRSQGFGPERLAELITKMRENENAIEEGGATDKIILYHEGYFELIDKREYDKPKEMDEHEIYIAIPISRIARQLKKDMEFRRIEAIDFTHDGKVKVG